MLNLIKSPYSEQPRNFFNFGFETSSSLEKSITIIVKILNRYGYKLIIYDKE